jgi:V-type H+-transporting ATPase subunit E
MKKRNDLMDNLASETSTKLKTFAKPDNVKYRNLIKQLIIQGMVKLLETTVLVQVRNIDVDFVKKLLPECQKEYAELLKRETGEEYKCNLEVDERQFLSSETGGVNLLTMDKKITLINDLESRLKLAFDQHLPTLKSMLFPGKK